MLSKNLPLFKCTSSLMLWFFMITLLSLWSGEFIKPFKVVALRGTHFIYKHCTLGIKWRTYKEITIKRTFSNSRCILSKQKRRYFRWTSNSQNRKHTVTDTVKNVALRFKFYSISSSIGNEIKSIISVHPSAESHFDWTSLLKDILESFGKDIGMPEEISLFLTFCFCLLMAPIHS